ncbi:hypothetical protein KABACHOK_03510 [Brevundimonas phage vB_BpoS-Kabachok]|uniref:Uncharacterized protein n=1 Tax=Brevundimonas phage vB_BpoS-Kabachok TaxID=2948600 RepID=A0A9E7SLV5_9CAUD|nr:hypothetical protein KABACHOK_03510 [Brevundimonas phage vB_BpoS-Kabachok]
MTSRTAWQKEVDDLFWGGEPFADRQRRVETERRERWSQEVRINPSAEVLVGLCRKARSQGLRGMLHQGDLYWWQAYYATHHDVLHWMAIPGNKLATGVELHVFDDGAVGLTAFDPAAFEACLIHPSLIGRIDAEGVLISR